MKIGIVGATGLIGRTLIRILEESNFSIDIVFLSATKNSAGKQIPFKGTNIEVVDTSNTNILKKCDVVIMACAPDVSSKWSPLLMDYSKWIIDISNAHRHDASIPLVVPEINGDLLKEYTGIISNPNCSTIQLVKSLFPFQKLFGLGKVIVSTYQSVSGMGQRGLELFDDEKELSINDSPLSKNFTPFIGSTDEHGYCQEEWKIINESRRILDSQELAIIPTTVRVPIKICHGESVYVETKKSINRMALDKEIVESPFLTYCDDPEKLMNTTNNTHVHIGRLRYVDKFTAQFWSTADNLLVGSAWNAFQIIDLLRKVCDG